MSKTMLAILRILEKYQSSVMGSREISRQLKLYGIELTERTVRYHLKILDERGLTRVFGKEGRQITELGIEELSKSHVSDRIGFIISKIETLAYQTTFDADKGSGKLILNVSFFPEEMLAHAVQVIGKVMQTPYVMSNRVILAREGRSIGDMEVPEGMVGIGTVCSVTINGIFLKAGIPVTSRFGGLVQVDEKGPQRFVSVIGYEGSSMDPHLIFIKSGMTSVSDAVAGKGGNILASFREFPVVCFDQAVEIRARLAQAGVGGILEIGNPNQPLLEMPVGIDRAGLVVVGGLNPVAAMEEAGIPTENTAMSILVDYAELVPFEEAARAVAGK